jgi:tol-pal system protein YbgF
VVAATLISMTAGAQQQSQTTTARPVTPAGKAPAAVGKDTAAAPATDSALRQRVEQLEEQLVDMQVVIGTLESLAKGAGSGGGGGPRANAGSQAAVDAADAGRLDGLETQIRAMAAQLEQLQDQVRALAGRNGALAPTTSFASNDQQVTGRPNRSQTDADPDKGGFGSVTVSPDAGKKDDIGSLISTPGDNTGAQQGGGGGGGGQDGDAADPKQLYSTAYGYLIQRDYGAAEAAFDDFLRQYPNHPLAGNALYWMGESLFVRGQYRTAASAFLKSYQNYGKSDKAPESLLKLAMSLQRLGQKDAACSSFNELSTKYPNAPARVKTTAQTERQRGGC